MSDHRKDREEMEYIKEKYVKKRKVDSSIGSSVFNQLPLTRPLAHRLMTHEQIGLEFIGRMRSRQPSNVLYLRIVNAIYPITCDVMFKACQIFGPILRLGIANDMIVDVLVEFANPDSAATAVEKFDGMDLYPGCCTLMADYASAPTITVFSHSEETWDFTVTPPFLIDTSRKTLLMETPRIVFDKEKMRPGMLALELALPAKNETPSRTLVLTIFDDMPRLDCFVFYRICSPFGEVLRVVIFRRMSLLAMVEFGNREAAAAAKTALHGCNIFPNMCTLRTEFTDKENLQVSDNSINERWDFTVSGPLGGYAAPVVNYLLAGGEMTMRGCGRRFLLNAPTTRPWGERTESPEKIQQELNKAFKQTNPSKVVLLTLMNDIYALNCFTIYKVCSQFAKPKKVMFFRRLSLQCFVEFNTLDDARLAKEGLHGCDIYPDCCTIRAEFTSKETLRILENNERERWNFELEPYNDNSIGGSRSEAGRRVLICESPFPSFRIVDHHMPVWKVNEELDRPYRTKTPSKVILLTVHDDIFPIDCDIIQMICRPYGSALRIIMFRRLCLQVMVEFATKEEAEKALKGLHGCNIYPNCCTLRAEFTEKENLTVTENVKKRERWDYTK